MKLLVCLFLAIAWLLIGLLAWGFAHPVVLILLPALAFILGCMYATGLQQIERVSELGFPAVPDAANAVGENLTGPIASQSNERRTAEYGKHS